MYKFNKKQKIIIGIFIAIVLGIIAFYIYANDNSDLIISNELETEKITNVKEGSKEESKEENKEEKSIVIHISGSVNNEGVVELKENSRISDAVEKAGGLKDNADISKINLAYLLEDGMKIYIPNVDETRNNKTIENVEDNTQNYITTNANLEGENNLPSKDSTQNKKVNINTATQTELETLPGIGPSIALKIINYRKENGRFNKIEDIKNVSGIGDSKFNNIKNYVVIK